MSALILESLILCMAQPMHLVVDAYGQSSPPSHPIEENTNCDTLKDWRDKAQCYFTAGHRYDQRGDTAHAILNYNRSIAVDPRVFHSSGRNPCGCHESDASDGSWDEYDPFFSAPKAIVDREAAKAPGLEEAVKNDPNYAMAWLKLAHHYSFVNYHGGIITGAPIKTPAFDRAVADFSKAIELDPDYEWAWSDRAREYLGAGDFGKAVDDFSMAIKLDPTSVIFWESRANAYARKGDFDRAKEDFDKIIEIRPNDASGWMLRGELYKKMGEQEKSDADYCKAAFVDAHNQHGIRFLLEMPACRPK